MHRVWVSMAGVAGIGKSTLADQIGATLRQRDTPVDVFGEDELFIRPEFARVANGFRTKRYAPPEGFEAAYRAWLSTLVSGAVAIMDWNPAAMTGDLPWATGDRERFRRHLASVHQLAGGKIIVLHLHAPAEIALARASRQRGVEWIRRADEIARNAGHRHRNRDDRLIAETVQHERRNIEELRMAAGVGWQVHPIDATPDPTQVRDRAVALIDAATCLRG